MPYFVSQSRYLLSPVQIFAPSVSLKTLLRYLLKLLQFHTKKNIYGYIFFSDIDHSKLSKYIVQYSCSQFPPVSLRRAATN